MKPNFTLDLGHDGIGLYHRSASGAWLEIGSVPLDDTRLRENLGFLRKTATGISGRGFATKIVIPDSQVMYTQVRAPGPSDDDRRAQIRTALEGATPYAVDDLAFDWSGEGEVLQLAVVARETLDEAEEFAVDHRMNPVCIVAAPQPDEFTGEPFFGRTDYATALLGPDTRIEADAQPFQASGKLLKDAPAIHVPSGGAVAQDQPTPVAAPSAEVPIASAESPDLEALIAPLVREVQNDAAPAPKARKGPGRMAGATAALRARAGAAVAALAGIAAGLGGRFAGIGKGLTAKARSLPRPAMPSFRRGQDEAAPVPVTEVLPDEPAASSVQAPANDDSRPPARVIFASRRSRAAVVILLGLGIAAGAGAFLAFRDGGDVQISAPTPGGTDATPATAVATAPATDDAATPAPRRPITANTASPTLDVLPAIRPVPRPEERVPDTAELVTELTPDEIAAIQAAGLPVPAGVSFDIVAASRTPLATDPDTGAQHATPVLIIPAVPADDWGSTISGFDPPSPPADAVALPPLADAADPPLLPVPLPPAPGAVFAFDDNGFVTATREGAATPDGAVVFAGKPALTPPDKPVPPEVERQQQLAAARPKPRPENLETLFLTAKFGGLTPEQLAEIRPRARPASDQLLAALEEGGTTPTEQAVESSRVPRGRPDDFADTVEKQREAKSVAEATAPQGDGSGGSTAPALVIPTRASIAERATIKNAINLSQLNLIGVYGKSTDRRALMRTAQGRFVKVKVGDRLDGGKIAAISSNTVSYVKGGNSRVLKVPQ